ncbi:4'-phosphopantetheinyl transferase family protein [Streptomyces sp. NPDC058527]|uniref:4'-phosphopantetheinyl transferase family protein n=1 Tax=Streptomyces sp. NPDC058527 TaxID=3346539 RepID=UPI00365E702A
MISAGFTGRPVLVHLADGDARAVTLLGRVDEAADCQAADCQAEADDARAAATLTGARRREFLGGRALLRRAVAQLTGVRVESVRIGARDDNRPVCLSFPEVDVSISHSAGRIAVTAARGCDVGVDIQIPVPVSDRLLHRFGIAGTEHAQTAPTEDLSYQFADAWTVREACAKSLGLRASADLWRIRVPPKARRGHWGGAHWYRVPPFHGCPVALALRPRAQTAEPLS